MPKDRTESTLSIIIPVRQEPQFSEKILKLLALAQNAEVVVVDTSPNPLVTAQYQISDNLRYFHRPELHYRSQAMNFGVAQSSRKNLWFLHLDCIPPHESPELIESALKTYDWGFFNKTYSPTAPILKILSIFLKTSYRFTTGFIVGTNGIFIRKDLFIALGMYPNLPIGEDLALINQLKSHHPFSNHAHLSPPIIVSSRKYQSMGGYKRICINVIVYVLYKIGIKPTTLEWVYKINS